MKILGDIMTSILNLFFQLTNNYAISIILITILIKMILYPLTLKQMKSMRDMQAIQPKMKEIQDKYKDNPEKLQKEVAELFRENNVNPAGGCLPLLVQMPILIALYSSLSNPAFIAKLKSLSVLHPEQVKFLWITQLHVKGMTNIVLILLMAASTYLTMIINKTPTTDKMQAAQMKIMTAFMPAMMVFIGYGLPSGVLLYWFASNLITVVQQYFIMKKFSPKKEVLN